MREHSPAERASNSAYDFRTILNKVKTMKQTAIMLLLISVLLLPACTSAPEGETKKNESATTTGGTYICPMHPQVRSDKPGICPICNMDLVLESNSAGEESSGGSEMVALNENDQLLANVATTHVRYENVVHVVQAFGTLEAPEPGKTVVSARFGGRIEKIYVDAVGASVRAGDPLFDVYSPDIVQAANEYLQAVTSHGTEGGNSALMKTRLQLLGLTDDQISDLVAAGTAPLVVTYRAPAPGTVTGKSIVQGSYVSEGTTLYELADFSTLWNIADVYESDARYLTTGMAATFSTAAYPGVTFKGTVSFIYPVVDPQARSVKVRMSVDNGAGKLRPNMYTETTFRKVATRALTVPASAVLLTGKRNLVYVRTETVNHFQAREVQVGSRFDGKYEIVEGLTEGDEVVVEGGYLIDSESQLKYGPAESHQERPEKPNSASAKQPAGHTH